MTGSTEPLELALLQDAQELGLCGQAHLADLIEEQHSSRGEFQLAWLCLVRARECAALVSKQLGFEQLLGKGGTVQRHERTALPRGRCVDEPRDDFLAGAGLAGHEHRRIGLATCVALRSTSRHSGDSPAICMCGALTVSIFAMHQLHVRSIRDAFINSQHRSPPCHSRLWRPRDDSHNLRSGLSIGSILPPARLDRATGTALLGQPVAQAAIDRGQGLL